MLELNIRELLFVDYKNVYFIQNAKWILFKLDIQIILQIKSL